MAPIHEVRWEPLYNLETICVEFYHSSTPTHLLRGFWSGEAHPLDFLLDLRRMSTLQEPGSIDQYVTFMVVIALVYGTTGSTVMLMLPEPEGAHSPSNLRRYTIEGLVQGFEAMWLYDTPCGKPSSHCLCCNARDWCAFIRYTILDTPQF